MTKQILVIDGDLPTLNDIIRDSRANIYLANNNKKGADGLVVLYARSSRLKPVKRADFVFHWYCKNKRKDKDNIAAGRKFIFDGLQKAGVIKNDGWKEIGDWQDKFYVDKENPRIEVEIIEVE